MDKKDKRDAPPSDDRGGEKKGDYKSTPAKGGGGRRDVSSLDSSTVPSAPNINVALKTLADYVNYLRGAEGVERVEGAEPSGTSAAKIPAAPEEDVKPSPSSTDGAVAPAWTSLINPDANINRRVVVRKRGSLGDAVRKSMTYMQIAGEGHPLLGALHSIAEAALGRVWNYLPNNLMDMVREWSAVPTSGRSGNYLGQLGGSETRMKTGESINLEYRVIEVQKGKENECFVIFLGNELIPLGFIAQSDVAEIMGLHLKILEGMDASRKGRIEEKVARQLTELIIHAAFDVRSGPVLEFLLLRPDEKIREMAGVESMFEALETLGNNNVEFVEVAGRLCNCRKSYDLDTWATWRAVIGEDALFRLLMGSGFGCGVTPYQCRLTVDDASNAGFADAYPTCPFLDDVDHIANNIDELVQNSTLDRDSIREELDEVPKDWAFAPKDKTRYAATAMDRLAGALGNQPTDTLIRMRGQTIEILREYKKEWFYGVLVKKEITIRVLGEGIKETLIETKSGHFIWSRGSHYLMYAPNESFDIRRNAIRGLVDEGVLMYSMGLLGAASLHSLAQNMTSLAMLLVGLDGKGGGSWRDALHYTVPKGVVAPNFVPGQKDLCVPFGFDLKQFGAVLRLLTQLGRRKFNLLLKALDSDARIQEIDGAYWISFSSTKTFQYNHLDAGTESEWLVQSYDLLATFAGPVHVIVGGLLQTLFQDVARSNDTNQSRHNRLNALIQRVKSESGDSAGRLLAIISDLPDMYVKGSSPDQWMKRFVDLKDNMEESNRRSEETFVVRMLDQSQKSKAVYKDWSSWIGLADGSTPVVGLKREMLEEIGVSFDVEAVKKARRASRGKSGSDWGVKEEARQKEADKKKKRNAY